MHDDVRTESERQYDHGLWTGATTTAGACALIAFVAPSDRGLAAGFALYAVLAAIGAILNR